MSRAVSTLLFSAALSLIAIIQPKAQAQAAIPDYFFKSWTVNRDCTEAHAGISGHTSPGLKFRVVQSSEGSTTYTLQPEESGSQHWSSGWSGVNLEYRAGTPMSTIPADMECVPGQEESSAFLAMTGFASSAEPYYGYEHWYGQVTIHGETHHLLIFPQAANGASSAAILLIDVDAQNNLQLDHNGTIIVEN